MNQLQGYTANSLRFTRWSRSRSAVFHSLSRSVSIGHLSVSVLRSLERKTETLSFGQNNLGVRSSDAYIEEVEESFGKTQTCESEQIFLSLLSSYLQNEDFAQSQFPYLRGAGLAHTSSSRQDRL